MLCVPLELLSQKELFREEDLHFCMLLKPLIVLLIIQILLKAKSQVFVSYKMLSESQPSLLLKMQDTKATWLLLSYLRKEILREDLTQPMELMWIWRKVELLTQQKL